MRKISLFTFVVFTLFSCSKNTKKTIDFTVVELTQQDFTICEENKCPKIDIGYLVASGNDSVSENINKELGLGHIQLLSISPEPSVATSVKDAVKNFIVEYQKFRKDYPTFPAGYEIFIADEIAYRTEEIVVVKTEHYLFTGGAHGYGATSLNTFSMETGHLLRPKDLFTDIGSFTAYAEKKFRKKYNVPVEKNINATGFFFENDVFSLPNNLAILKNEVLLIYNPYEAAAYAQGEMILRFPKADVKQWLKYE